LSALLVRLSHSQSPSRELASSPPGRVSGRDARRFSDPLPSSHLRRAVLLLYLFTTAPVPSQQRKRRLLCFASLRWGGWLLHAAHGDGRAARRPCVLPTVMRAAFSRAPVLIPVQVSMPPAIHSSPHSFPHTSSLTPCWGTCSVAAVLVIYFAPPLLWFLRSNLLDFPGARGGILPRLLTDLLVQEIASCFSAGGF
jgi:hypothetical protein